MGEMLTIEGADHAEIWVLLPNFAAFEAEYPGCRTALESFCGLEGSQVKLFVFRLEDLQSVGRLAFKYRANAADLVPCTATAGSLPEKTVLRRMKSDNTIDYFEATAAGFRALPKTEGDAFEVSLKERWFTYQ